MRNGGSKVIALNANVAQPECNRLVFLNKKVVKVDVLCLLDIGAFHNFITRESAEKMELHLEELKAPIEVHFADGVPHPTTLQAKEVHFADGVPHPTTLETKEVHFADGVPHPTTLQAKEVHFADGVPHPTTL